MRTVSVILRRYLHKFVLVNGTDDREKCVFSPSSRQRNYPSLNKAFRGPTESDISVMSNLKKVASSSRSL
jgi:hypothetical protein